MMPPYRNSLWLEHFDLGLRPTSSGAFSRRRRILEKFGQRTGYGHELARGGSSMRRRLIRVGISAAEWLELRRLPPDHGFCVSKYSLLIIIEKKPHSTLQRGMLHTAAWGQRQGW